MSSPPDPSVEPLPARAIQMQSAYSRFARALGYHLPQRLTEARRLALAQRQLVGQRRKR